MGPGLLWGARTIEQAVRTGQGTVPAGSITDIPRFAYRGATLCACGTHITPDWITRQIDRMPDLKMNYLPLELRIKSDKYPVAQQFSFDRIDEYMEAFGSTEWHMGADEFFFKQGPGDFKKYLAQIRSHYGAQMFWNTKTPKADGNAEAFKARIKAEAAAADSVETRWERGKESMATDGDPATYWHSQYIDANKAKLPGTDNARK